MARVIGYIRVLEKLRAVFTEHMPQTDIHIATQQLPRYSYIEPIETYSSNIMCTENMLEMMLSTSSVMAAINVTRDMYNKNCEWMRGHRKNDPIRFYDHYSRKFCTEHVALTYRSSCFHLMKMPNRCNESWKI